jgi:cytochrome oxidase Cu insertion factor (SCO1/SenC/PrrC family)
MRRPVLALFSFGIAIALLMSACASGPSSSSSTTAAPDAPRGYKPTPVRKTDTVSLPDYANDPGGVDFSFKAAPGNLLVVFFGFLTCPDICPVTMADIAAGLEQSGPNVDQHIEVAFVTVDFERDTGPRMVEYLTHFFPNSTIHALRAPDSIQLSAVTSQFGAQWQVDPHEPGAATYGVAHSGVTYVVDDRGQLVWEWPFGTTGPEVAATLKQLMDTVYPAS